jgi:hypothetical protein
MLSLGKSVQLCILISLSYKIDHAIVLSDLYGENVFNIIIIKIAFSKTMSCLIAIVSEFY